MADGFFVLMEELSWRTGSFGPVDCTRIVVCGRLPVRWGAGLNGSVPALRSDARGLDHGVYGSA